MLGKIRHSFFILTGSIKDKVFEESEDWRGFVRQIQLNQKAETVLIKEWIDNMKKDIDTKMYDMETKMDTMMTTILNKL